jgi:hypothetical protein
MAKCRRKAWDDRKVFRHVIGDREGGQSTSGHQELLTDLDDFDRLERLIYGG